MVHMLPIMWFIRVFSLLRANFAHDLELSLWDAFDLRLFGDIGFDPYHILHLFILLSLMFIEIHDDF